MAVNETQILDALRVVKDPDLGKDIVTLGMVKDVNPCGDLVKFTLTLKTPSAEAKARLVKEAKAAVEALDGITMANVLTETEVSAPFGRNSPFAEGVKNFIAVGSGKGGVGKSTVSINLAVGLAKLGAKVGLLDTDVYGPSVPTLAGITREEYLEFAGAKQAEQKDKDGISIPAIEKYGIKIMTIGFLVDPDKAVIWRGPMVHGAVQQFLRDTQWGELDYLIIDMPPGTGDVQLTLSQTIPLTGSVIVSTPQKVALADVRKAYGMFQTTKTPVLGLVENMSGSFFGSSGAENYAKEIGIPFLGTIPMDAAVCESGDSGKPVMVDGEGPGGEAFAKVVENLAAAVAKHNYSTRPRRQLKILKT